MAIENEKLLNLEDAQVLYNDLRDRHEDLADDVSDLLNEINVLTPSATSSDVGKFLKAKTVSGGKVTEYEFGEGGSSVTVDDELSMSSTNPVQNKVVTSEVNDLSEAVFFSETGKVVAPDLFQTVTNVNLQLEIGTSSFTASESLYGFYVDVSECRGKEILISRWYNSKVLRGVFTHDVPAVGITFSSDDKWEVSYYYKRGVYLTVPNNANINYLYVAYYSSTASGITQAQALEGMKIFQPDQTNYFNQASEEMMLAFTSGSFTQASSLYGFYVPIDENASIVNITRTNAGTRFRFGFSEDVPAVGVSYSGYTSDTWDTLTMVWLQVPEGAKYIYVAYYRTQDTLTKEQLLAGMTIRYNVPSLIENGEKVNRIENLDHSTGVKFVNGLINSSGAFVTDSKHITSDFVKVDGVFKVSVPSSYVMKVHLFDGEKEYISSVEKTNGCYKLENGGYARFTIEASDESDIDPDTVDFSQIKIPGNRFSALTFANEKTFILDAENITSSDVFAYLDRSVASHGMYATKTFLCNESSGLPIYYYTLGNGAKKMCLIGGQHGPESNGDPRDGVIILAKMLHDLIEGEFANGSFLQKIHDEYTVIVVPVLNVYGFNNRKRTNAENTDINRDWITTPTTAEVTAAKALIDDFAPDIALDVHTNGTNPIVNEDIEIQFGLGSHNSAFKSAVQSKFKSYYDTDVLERTPNTNTTLQYYIINTLEALGGLLELRWWIKSKKIMHDSQAESADYAMIVNALKYCDSVSENETFTWEKTPNQSQN